jgi:trimeric autotransporter adhesin
MVKLLLATFLAVAVGAVQAQAATFTVNSVADAVDASPGDGVCETAPGNGVCTLRAAIQEANAAGSGQIVVPSGTYTLMLAGAGATNVGDLDITGNVTVTGAGAATTIVQACTVDQLSAACPSGQGIADRVLQIQPGAHVTLSGITIRNGYASSGSVNFGFGGGILNAGTLTLTDVIVIANRADVSGAGIANGRSSAAGTLTLNSSTVTRNSVAAGQGGGIYNATFPGLAGPVIVLNNSTVSENSAGNGGGIGGTVGQGAGSITVSSSVISGNRVSGCGGGILAANGTLTLVSSMVVANVAGSGGGICHQAENAAITLTSSTVSGNATTGSGAGILHLGGASGFVTVTNSSINGNTSSAGNGGGLYLQVGAGGALTVTNTTFSGNSANNGGALAVFGGGVPVNLSSVTITSNTATALQVGGGGVIGEGVVNIKNTVLAGNLAANGFPDCSSDTTLTSRGFNLIGDGTGCGGITRGANGDLVGTSAQPIAPLLASLSSQGGPTPTHALLAGSPAIDAGDPSGCSDALGNLLLTDQRGEPRTLDGNGDGVARCDIGAFELRGGASAFALSGVKPAHAGNADTAVVLLYGSGFASGMTATLRRAGQPDIAASPVTVTDGGAAAATTFDLTGQAAGAWDVVLTRPDGTSVTLAGAFTVDAGGAPQLWADLVIPRGYRVGMPTTFFLIYGNRGNVDAFGVPLGLSVPTSFPFRPGFPIAPPPSQPSQVPMDWTRVPIVAKSGTSDPTAIPLLLPVVPAAFTGVLPLTLTATGTGPFAITFGIGDPYFQPALNARVVSALVHSAEVYAARVYGASPGPSQASRESYATTQLDAVVTSGVDALIQTAGTQAQVYSLAQLLVDLAQFTASNRP